MCWQNMRAEVFDELGGGDLINMSREIGYLSCIEVLDVKILGCHSHRLR